jgi:6-methylsalicylate decarboxylase
MMSEVNVSKSILSITSPGVHLQPNNDTLAERLTRLVNDAGADLKSRHPSKFGYFASLPVPNISLSLAEIKRTTSRSPSPDGFTFETNKHGVYLGDSALDPVFAALNDLHATVFIHPTTPCMPDGHTAAVPVTLFPRSTYEFFFDTCRAVINLFARGVVSRSPNLTFIIPHMGGAFPPLIDRFSRVGPLLGLPGIDDSLSPEFVRERLNKQFYFDTAGWPFPAQVHGILQYVTPDRILYGTDFPFTPLRAVIACSDSHDQHLNKVFPRDGEVEAVCRGNAKRLLKME